MVGDVGNIVAPQVGEIFNGEGQIPLGGGNGVVKGKGKMTEERGGPIRDGIVGDCEHKHQRIVQWLLVEHDAFKGRERLEAGSGQVEGDGGLMHGKLVLMAVG